MLLRLEEGVLSALLHAKEELAVAQVNEILGPIFDKMHLSALYTTLDRLEAKGMPTCSMGEPSPKRGGRAPNLYRITVAGSKALRETELMNAALAVLKRSPEIDALEASAVPIHPGRLLDEYFRQLEWPVAYAAGHLGVTREHLYTILRGQVGISPSMAKALARNDIGGTALDWLMRQAKFDLAQPERPATPRRSYKQEPNR